MNKMIVGHVLFPLTVILLGLDTFHVVVVMFKLVIAAFVTCLC